MADAGLTFSPLNTQPGQPGRGSNTVQDAIKLLSFRLPTTGPTASPLLGPPTGGMPGTSSWLMQLLQGLIRNPGTQTGQTGQPPLGPPRPSVQLATGPVPSGQGAPTGTPPMVRTPGSGPLTAPGGGVSAPDLTTNR